MFNKDIKKLSIKRQLNLLCCICGQFYPHNNTVKILKPFVLIKLYNKRFKIKIDNLYMFLNKLLMDLIPIYEKAYLEKFFNDFKKNKIQQNQFKELKIKK